MKQVWLLCVISLITIPMGHTYLNKKKMRHLKNIEEFKRTNEQLFRTEANFLKGMLGGDDKKSDGGTSSNSTSSGPISNKEDIADYGKFSQGKEKTSPLVVVYGGVNVGGRKSGEYMYDYFNQLGNSVNLFVAKDHNVNGKSAYNSLKNKMSEQSIRPSKKILYLFSGGYNPGMDLLKSVGASEFDLIYLVDIWMGSDTVSSFYKKLAKDNKNKVKYFYTSFGGNNKSATDEISSAVLTKKLNGNNDHMSTNLDALSDLKGSI